MSSIRHIPDQKRIKESLRAVCNLQNCAKCSSGKLQEAMGIVNGRREESFPEELMLALRSEGWSGGVSEEKSRRAFQAAAAGCTWASVHLRNWDSVVPWRAEMDKQKGRRRWDRAGLALVSSLQSLAEKPSSAF